ncbi:hypothetical protein NDU88_000209 [Pleurodeles waltl]|uniref:Uncharacterized protein n=1 Tax=Pleurodeles waltl TaxID=8319 RepID=A0AAV7KND6_PLEWA|nr:hypothetical protein NDU88_000209 [Pleurodeles waltl]
MPPQTVDLKRVSAGLRWFRFIQLLILMLGAAWLETEGGGEWTRVYSCFGLLELFTISIAAALQESFATPILKHTWWLPTYLLGTCAVQAKILRVTLIPQEASWRKSLVSRSCLT